MHICNVLCFMMDLIIFVFMSTYLSCIIDSKKDGRKCGETIAKSCLLGKKSHIFFMDVDAI